MNSNVRKQAWIVDTIKRHRSLTLKEIQDLWIQNEELNPYGKSMQGRTFHRHRIEIRETYGIDIKCYKPLNEYYINYDYSDKDEIKSWIFDTISIDNLIKENKGLKDRILVERTNTGHSFLPIIIDAMRTSRQIEFTYKKFLSNEEYKTTLSTYCIKVFSQRWYIVGITPRHPSEIRTFALDRVRTMNVTDLKFHYPKNFSPEDYFANNVGIFHSDAPVSYIEIKVYGTSRCYIRSLPIHPSQVEIESDDELDYSIFALRVSINEDLIREIMKNGCNIAVIEPLSLKNEILSRLKKSIKNYTK